MKRLDLSLLDPGIVDVVVALRRHGFQTTDSGDGRSKTDDPDAYDVEHVAMKSRPPERLIPTALDVPAGQVVAVLNVIAEARPEEEWQVEFTVSMTSSSRKPVETITAWKVPHCIAYAGLRDDPDFDFCRACGRSS